MSEAQQSDGTPLPLDTPVDAARRRAFDHPTIDNLRDLEAVATAQSDAARVAAEERAHQMEVWGSEKVVGDLERLIEILGPWHDDESCDSFADLVGEVESRLRAAEDALRAIMEVAEKTRWDSEETRQVAMYGIADAALKGLP